MAGEVLADFPRLRLVDGEFVRPAAEDGGLGEAVEWAPRDPCRRP
jgi:hypothetical protein